MKRERGGEREMEKVSEREMEGDGWTAEREKNIEKEWKVERERDWVNWSLKIKGGRERDELHNSSLSFGSHFDLTLIHMPLVLSVPCTSSKTASAYPMIIMSLEYRITSLSVAHIGHNTRYPTQSLLSGFCVVQLPIQYNHDPLTSASEK